MGDVRKIGSGNIGATNVLRTGNKGLAAGTLLLDLLKGLAPVLIAERLGGEVAAALPQAAVLGHRFPSGSASGAARASPPMRVWPSGSPGR